MLRFNKVYKVYGRKPVLRNVSHCFSCGAFALQGPNGIGKSTLLAVLAGIVQPDSGDIWIDGHALRSVPLVAKSRLSYVPDECPAYPFMTGRELLRFVARAKRCDVAPAVWDLAGSFGLLEHMDTRFAEMSLGTQKKIMLTAAWIGDPAVMLMDEPSNGLDRVTRGILIELVKERCARSVMLISTHDAEFVNAVGASVIIFDELVDAGATGS